MQSIALLACALAASGGWSWYAKSKNKGHLFLAVAFSIAALAFVWLAILN